MENKDTNDKLMTLVRSMSPADIEQTQTLIKERSQQMRSAMACYKCAMMEVETKFKVLDQEFSLAHDRNPIADIRTRLKSPESIAEKLQRLNVPFSLDSMRKNLFDIAGVRIICNFPEDVYTLADALLRQDDIKLVSRKDYIANPKPNGYRSLHLIVEVPVFFSQKTMAMNVEFQLRTIAMDFWASLEHQLKYKKGLDDVDSLTAELKDCADRSAELDMRMQLIRQALDSRRTGDDE